MCHVSLCIKTETVQNVLKTMSINVEFGSYFTDLQQLQNWSIRVKTEVHSVNTICFFRKKHF